jgi:hypothetical protein
LVDPDSIPPADPTAAQQAVAINAAKAAAGAYMDGNGVHCPGGGTGCITATFQKPSAMPSIDVVIQYDYHGLTGFLPVILPNHVYAHAVMRWQ